MHLPPISESQLRARLKKSATSLERLQDMWFKSFLQSTSCKVVSGDQMMNKALGPVWHTKQKAQGIIPEGLRGLDTEATWSKSHSDGWVYGHGSFCLVSHNRGAPAHDQSPEPTQKPPMRKQRGQTVEPMQGVMKDIFALERCWMRGQRNNRWLFAAMGVAVQLHQARALKAHRSTWKIKQEVLGL